MNSWEYEEYHESKSDLMRDMEPKHQCPECGHTYKQEPSSSIENTDRDGNRGIEMYCVTCPECNEEECWYGY